MVDTSNFILIRKGDHARGIRLIGNEISIASKSISFSEAITKDCFVEIYINYEDNELGFYLNGTKMTGFALRKTSNNNNRCVQPKALFSEIIDRGYEMIKGIYISEKREDDFFIIKNAIKIKKQLGENK